jgi:hypothetical protein
LFAVGTAVAIDTVFEVGDALLQMLRTHFRGRMFMTAITGVLAVALMATAFDLPMQAVVW